MATVWLILSALAAIGGVGCSLYVVYEAFQDEVWKGFVCFLCFFYWLYFALVDFDHDYKWPIVLGALGGNGIAAGLYRLYLTASGNPVG